METCVNGEIKGLFHFGVSLGVFKSRDCERDTLKKECGLEIWVGGCVLKNVTREAKGGGDVEPIQVAGSV